MPCDCRTQIETKVAEHAKGRWNIDNAKVDIKGFALSIDDALGLHQAAYLQMEVTGTLQKKTGVKQKTIKTTIQFTYCPFCAQPYKTPEPEQTQ